MDSNWCDACQDVCHDHPTICSICGAALTVPPSDAMAYSDANSDPNNDNEPMSREEELLREMQQASRELRNVLGNLRGQVQDLDVLTRNILNEQENGNGIPQEFWDPQHADTAQLSRPTSKEALKKIPRFVLNDHSTLFRQATLRVSSDLNANGDSSTTPVVFVSGGNESTHQTMDSVGIHRACSDISNAKTIRNIDCTLGEFGSAGEHMFEMGTSFVLASPVTGKGGLDKETKARISYLKAHAHKVILLMQRGDGITFVQKARMAQDAGAAAVIIGNNTPNPWPYVMKDSKGESKKRGQSVFIPVAMIKEEDCKEIMKVFGNKKKMALLKQCKQSQPPIPTQIILGNEKRLIAQHQSPMQPSFSSRNGEYDDFSCLELSLACELVIRTQSCDCPVCCEEMKTSETVIQLPGCGHIFHESCALEWLKSHNTCPYCRRELPTDDPEYERERRRRQQADQGQRSNVGSTENINTNGGSFYG